MIFERNPAIYSYEMPTTSAVVSFNENPEMIHSDMRQPKEYEIQVNLKKLRNYCRY